MNKIIALSSNGFQIDSTMRFGDTPRKWFTCDKNRIIDSGRFKDLKVGLELTDIKLSKDGKYVIDFVIVKEEVLHECIICGEKVPLYCLSSSICHKCILSNSKIKVGRDVLERDGGNYTNPLNIPLKNINSESKPSSVQDNIKKDGLMYGQSINLGFQYVLKNFDCTDEMFWSEVFNQADKCYNEMLKRC